MRVQNDDNLIDTKTTQHLPTLRSRNRSIRCAMNISVFYLINLKLQHITKFHSIIIQQFLTILNIRNISMPFLLCKIPGLISLKMLLMFFMVIVTDHYILHRIHHFSFQLIILSSKLKNVYKKSNFNNEVEVMSLMSIDACSIIYHNLYRYVRRVASYIPN